MKQLLILALTLSLTGCFYQSANNTDLRKAEYFCNGLDNVDTVAVYFSGKEVVVCLDGNESRMWDIKLPPQGLEMSQEEME
jgi:hypothetical protein